MTLDPVRIRVLGALTENEIATPENYPLSLNALANASNPRSEGGSPLDTPWEALLPVNSLQACFPVTCITPMHDFSALVST